MKETWFKFASAFNQRNFRERLLIGVSLIAIVYLLWDFFYLTSSIKKRDNLTQRYEAVSKDMVILNSEQQILLKALRKDPLAEKKREIVRLEQEISVVDEALDNLSLGLVPAEKLTKILYDVLEATDSARFVNMEMKSPQLLNLSSSSEVIEDDGNTQLNSQPVGIYKHSVVIEMRGRYFEIVDYLDALEELGWRFYWESLEYNVSTYPSATVVLEVFTLSKEKGALGA